MKEWYQDEACNYIELKDESDPVRPIEDPYLIHPIDDVVVYGSQQLKVDLNLQYS